MDRVRSPILFFCLFTPVLAAVIEIGFQGLSSNVKVVLGDCRESYPHYYIAPVIPDLICPLMKLSPCGSFTEIKAHNVHARMLACLCRDTDLHHADIALYHNLHYLPSRRTTDVAEICRDRPREVFPR